MRLYQTTTKAPQFTGQSSCRDHCGRPFYRSETANREVAMARWRAAEGRADVWSWNEDDGTVIVGSGMIEAQR
jgi:hypothetical protein